MNTITSCYPEFMNINYMKCSNALYTGRDVVKLCLPSGVWNVSPCFSMQYADISYLCRIQAICDGEPFTILLSDYTILLPHDTPLEEGVLKSMPQNLIATALKILSEPIVAELENLFGKQCAIDTIQLSQESYAYSQGFYFIIKNDARTIYAFLECMPSSLSMQSLCTWWHQEKAQSSDVSNIKISCTPIIDAFTLTAKEFSTLKLYDCILGQLPLSVLDNGINVKCTLDDTISLHGTLIHKKLTIQGFSMHSDENFQNNAQDLDTTSSFSIEDISLKVAFALGTVDMTVGKVAQIQAGEVFIIDCDTSAPITVLVNGQAIGKGKLIDVAGRLGVQIVELKAR